MAEKFVEAQSAETRYLDSIPDRFSFESIIDLGYAVSKHATYSLKTWSCCGSSGAAFGLMGAEMVWVYRQMKKLNSKKYTRVSSVGAADEMARLLIFAISHIAFIGASLYSSFELQEGPQVGHSAHFGGLLFGVWMASNFSN